MNILSFAQVIVSLLIIVLIILQELSSGGLGIFGGGGGESFYQPRRGLEKFIFIATIVLMTIFAGLALLNLLV